VFATALWFIGPRAGAVYDCDDINLIFEDVVNDSIRPFDHFSNVDIICFWHDAA